MLSKPTGRIRLVKEYDNTLTLEIEHMEQYGTGRRYWEKVPIITREEANEQEHAHR